MNLLAQVEVTTTSDSSGGGVAIALGIIYAVIAIMALIGFWKTIDKTGQPGVWALLILVCYPLAMIPVLKAVGRPAWWVVLFFIPLVNLIMLFIVLIDLAKSFGHGAGYGVGLVLLPFIFFIMLGFGSDQYRGPVVQPV
jgi:membrane associated rhomboid family serine protease